MCYCFVPFPSGPMWKRKHETGEHCRAWTGNAIAGRHDVSRSETPARPPRESDWWLALVWGYMVHRRRHCCEDMKRNVEARYKMHPDPFDCPDNLIHCGCSRLRRRYEYGIIIHDGGGSFVLINYCPWCGADLRKNTAKKPPVHGRTVHIVSRL